MSARRSMHLEAWALAFAFTLAAATPAQAVLLNPGDTVALPERPSRQNRSWPEW